MKVSSLKLAANLLLFCVPIFAAPAPSSSSDSATLAPRKRVAIVGGGTAGLAALKAIVDTSNDDWQVDLFEARKSVGGLWVEDTEPVRPPRLPETPIYPGMRTITPHPTMTYPNFPFPPLTPLFPGHKAVAAYHQAFATFNNLTCHIHLRHSVTNASYANNDWSLFVSKSGMEAQEKKYDHLVVAAGQSHFPRVPEWNGTRDWLKGGESREVSHTVWYRDPESFKNKTVVIVGFGARGSDIAKEVMPFTRQVYHSYDSSSQKLRHPISGTRHVPRISHFNSTSVIFSDGSTLNETEGVSIILATGYDLVFPWLRPLSVDSGVANTSGNLSTDMRRIRPLHEHLFAISDEMPLNALSFIGLPLEVANGPSDYAQGLYVAHAIADNSWLPTQKEAMEKLQGYEKHLSKFGYDANAIGHRFPFYGQAEDYQDGLIETLREYSSIQLPEYLQQNRTRNYVEPWRKQTKANTDLIKEGWQRAEEEGMGETFLRGAVTENDWGMVMDRLAEWERRKQRSSESGYLHLQIGKSV